MRIQVVKLLTKIGLLGVFAFVTAVTLVQAQSLAYGLRATIPFDFTVADKKLTSGKYSIGRARQDSDDTVLSISDVDGSSRVIRLSQGVQTLRPKDKGTLVFHRYGDQYFLYQVWPAGETTGRQFVKSRSERNIERNFRGNLPLMSANEVETVTIVGVLQ
jgi:hypothetical protein